MSRMRPWGVAAGVAVCLGVLISVVASTNTRGEKQYQKQPTSQVRNPQEAVGEHWLRPVGTEAGYVGDQACAACHPRESASHRRSPHARTVQRINSAEARPEFRVRSRVVDSRSQVRYSVSSQNGKDLFTAEEAGHRHEASPDWVLGSGGQAHTYLCTRGTGFLEARISYYSQTGRWDYTPGRGPDSPPSPPIGNVYSPLEAASCFGCHSTVLVGDSAHLDLDRSHLNIGCESCHGPSRKHAEAASKGYTVRAGSGQMDAGTPPVPRGSSQLELCGECHRKPGEMEGAPIPAPDLGRLTGVALGRSRCFRESGGRLVCTTCHNPHEAAARAPDHYDSACNSCHRALSGKSCLRGETKNCVTCHMPERPISRMLPLKFHDHRIQRQAPVANPF